jgi:hypothetical protein
MFATAERACADMGMSSGTYYRVRKDLIKRGLIRCHQNPNGPTEYRVIAEAVEKLRPARQDNENEPAWWEAAESQSGTNPFQDGTQPSQAPDGGSFPEEGPVPEVMPEEDMKQTSEVDRKDLTENEQGSSSLGSSDDATSLSPTNLLFVEALVSEVERCPPQFVLALRGALQRYTDIALGNPGYEANEKQSIKDQLDSVLASSGLAGLSHDEQRAVLTYVWAKVLDRPCREQVDWIFDNSEGEYSVVLGLCFRAGLLG